MKLQIVSDLHLEFEDYDPVNEGADVLIMAGDCLNAQALHTKTNTRYHSFLAKVADRFDKVIYVAGNHEFYQGSWNSTLDYLYEATDPYPNVHFLENESISIKGINFSGTTMWTDCNRQDPMTWLAIKTGMRDYHAIRDDNANFRKINPNHTILRHKQATKWLATQTRDVTITHHLPSFKSVDPKYKDSTINPAFASNVERLITGKLWIHGHTHSKADYFHNDTRIICNPKGYPNENFNYAPMHYQI